MVSAGDEEKATEDSLTILGGLGSGGGLDMRKFALQVSEITDMIFTRYKVWLLIHGEIISEKGTFL